jgi:hypothetical protein
MPSYQNYGAILGQAQASRPFMETNIGPLSTIEGKEYKMFVLYGVRESAPHFNLIAQAMENDTWELLDLDLVESNMLDSLNFLKALKRFRRLQNDFPALIYSENGFFIDDHQFETLDEVEKAIKNKAFL